MHSSATLRKSVRVAVGMGSRGWDSVDSLNAMERFLGRQMAEVGRMADGVKKEPRATQTA